MSAEQLIKEHTLKFFEEVYNTSVDPAQISVENTRAGIEGDYTLVVFPFSRITKKKPEESATEIGSFITQNHPFFDRFNVVKGFLNLHMSNAYFTNQLAQALNGQLTNRGTNKRLTLIEYSSPNTNKPLHLGHLRNNFLGHSVSLIKQQSGNEVIKTQIINDRGVHICKSMLAWQRFGEGETPDTAGLKGDKFVGKYYVLYDQKLKEQVSKLTAQGMSEEEAKKEAALSKEVQQMLKQWEEGDSEVRTLWQKMNGWVYQGFEETYNKMQVEFDKLYYESDTFLKGKAMVNEGLAAGLFFQKDDGSIWADLTEDGLDQKLLVRGDGTTVYMTQDIGTAAQRFEDFPKLDQVIYTVGDEQDYHFKVLFLILEKLGYKWASNCKHLSYGMVDLPSGKMKSREGTVVDADDLIDQVIAKASEMTKEKGKLEDIPEAQWPELFETLGLGALKFFLLRVDPRKRMLFDPEESVSLTGDTGPFVQYTYARGKAVLRKAEVDNVELESAPSVLEPKEKEIIREMMRYPDIVTQAADDLSPAIIANYCLDLAKLFNQFYHECPILKAEDGQRNFRLAITQICTEIIANGLGLLGMKVPERM